MCDPKPFGEVNGGMLENAGVRPGPILGGTVRIINCGGGNDGATPDGRELAEDRWPV